VSHHVVQGWRTTATDEQMEFWSAPNYENVPAYSGDQFIELNANLVSGVYQDYQTPQPTVFSYAFAHRGRQGTDTCQLLAGPPGGPYVPVTTATTGNTAWVYYTGNYTVPAGQPVTRFIFQSISSVGGASVGNYLDAITFTANNGLLSENPMQLDCTNNIANVSAAGVGTWSAHADNPGATTIGNISNNDTTISGFSVSGTYRYDWTTQYCTSTLEITFDSGNIIAPLTTNIEYCQNETALPLTAEAQTGYTLNWYAAETGGTPLAGAPTPDTGSAGTVTYYVSQSSAQGCESTRAAITVTVNELPPVPLADDMSYCLGAIASQLTATPLAGNTLNWYASATEETPLTEAPTPVTDTEGTFTYYVSQQTAEGCESAREEITVLVNWNNSAIPITEFDFETTYCFDTTGAQPILAAGFTAGGTFTASNGLAIDPATGEVNFASVTPGIYTITYTVEPDLTLCNPGGSFNDTFTISSENIFTLQGDCQGSEYIIVPVDDLEGASYEWFDANGVPVGSERAFNVSNYVNSTPYEDVFPLDFELIVSINGCESTGTHTVDGISCMIQKGISPNNDDLNDSFDLSFMNVTSISIFNRYGQEVFSYGNYTNQWGGQDNSGNELPTGTYFYSFERANGETKTGWIYVNRQN
jgi:gliding motility-associated-like protein